MEFIGEIDDREKGEFLGRAMALLFPRFSVRRMARDYIELYHDVLRRSSIDAVVLSARTAGQREAA